MKKNILKKLTRNIYGPCFFFLASLVLAGCSGHSNFSDGDTQKRNIVEMVRIAYLITFEADSPRLSPVNIQSLDNFMMKSNISYGDELSMDFPLQRDGSLSPRNLERMTYLSHLLKERGLHLSADVTPYGTSPGDDRARLLISRYLVTPPLCGDWSQPSNESHGNSSMINLGCASQANLGLMIANPRDLLVGTSGKAPDAEKAARAVLTYRTKKSGKSSSKSSSSNKK